MWGTFPIPNRFNNVYANLGLLRETDMEAEDIMLTQGRKYGVCDHTGTPRNAKMRKPMVCSCLYM